MKSRDKLAQKLQSLTPESTEFYIAAAGYFRQRVRSHRNYGRFFLVLSLLSWALVCFHWGQWEVLWVLPGFLFFALLGWAVIIGATRTSKALYEADHDTDPHSRLQRLRVVALTFRGDPISVLVLQSSERQ